MSLFFLSARRFLPFIAVRVPQAPSRSTLRLGDLESDSRRSANSPPWTSVLSAARGAEPGGERQGCSSAASQAMTVARVDSITITHTHTADAWSPFCVFCLYFLFSCMVNRLISPLMWDLRVFDFIEGADTDQGAVAPHGLSAAAAKIREMKSVTPSISHDKAVQAIILDQIWDPSWKEKKKK